MNSTTNQLDSPKEVFFLGAGFSVFGGVPTFSNFREKAKNLQNTGINEKLFQKILDYWEKKYNKYNIEEFYATLEIQELLKITSSNEKSEIPTTKDIERFIAYTIKASVGLLTEIARIDSEILYRKFLNYIITTNTGIITTNWDIVLESSKDYKVVKNTSDKSDIKIESNYPPSNSMLEDNSIKYEYVHSYNNNLHNNSIMKYSVLKLHGSLNWGICSKCNKISYFDNIYENITYECNKNSCKGKLELGIVPPTLNKIYEIKNKSLKDIWKKALQYLSYCEKIYFIGYSFPETDIQMKYFVSNALRNNSDLKKVIIVSSLKHGNSRVIFEERYSTILSGIISPSNICFEYKGSENFCKKLVST